MLKRKGRRKTVARSKRGSQVSTAAAMSAAAEGGDGSDEDSSSDSEDSDEENVASSGAAEEHTIDWTEQKYVNFYLKLLVEILPKDKMAAMLGSKEQVMVPRSKVDRAIARLFSNAEDMLHLIRGLKAKLDRLQQGAQEAAAEAAQGGAGAPGGGGGGGGGLGGGGMGGGGGGMGGGMMGGGGGAGGSMAAGAAALGPGDVLIPLDPALEEILRFAPAELDATARRRKSRPKLFSNREVSNMLRGVVKRRSVAKLVDLEASVAAGLGLGLPGGAAVGPVGAGAGAAGGAAAAAAAIDEARELTILFREFDTNSDGFLSRDEIGRLLRYIDEDTDVEAVIEEFEGLLTHGQGLSLQSFLQAAQSEELAQKVKSVAATPYGGASAAPTPVALSRTESGTTVGNVKMDFLREIGENVASTSGPLQPQIALRVSESMATNKSTSPPGATKNSQKRRNSLDGLMSDRRRSVSVASASDQEQEKGGGGGGGGGGAPGLSRQSSSSTAKRPSVSFIRRRSSTLRTPLTRRSSTKGSSNRGLERRSSAASQQGPPPPPVLATGLSGGDHTTRRMSGESAAGGDPSRRSSGGSAVSANAGGGVLSPSSRRLSSSAVPLTFSKQLTSGTNDDTDDDSGNYFLENNPK